MRRIRRRTAGRRLVTVATIGIVGGLAAAAALELQPGPLPALDVDLPDLRIRAYLVATGIFALPPPGQGPIDFQAAHASAAGAGRPVAWTLWVEQESFESRAWRDLIQVGRSPYNRPPAIDFVREVAVLAWAVPGQASAEVLAAPGLVLRRAAVRHDAVEIGVGPGNGGPPPATPAAIGQAVLPYALVTVPRNQWPVPAPAPAILPLTVSLVR